MDVNDGSCVPDDEPETEEIDGSKTSERAALDAGVGRLIGAEVNRSITASDNNPLRSATSGLLIDHLHRRRVTGWVLWILGMLTGLVMFVLTVYDLATYATTEDIAPLVVKLLGTGGGFAAGTSGHRLKK